MTIAAQSPLMPDLQYLHDCKLILVQNNTIFDWLDAILGRCAESMAALHPTPGVGAG